MKYLFFGIIFGSVMWVLYKFWEYIKGSPSTGIGGTLAGSVLSTSPGFGTTSNDIAIGTEKTIDGYLAVWDGTEWEFIGSNGVPE